MNCNNLINLIIWKSLPHVFYLFLQNDFAKIQAKREAESRLMPARLPLQKSVSTPSIIAVRDLASATIQHDGAAPAIQP